MQKLQDSVFSILKTIHLSPAVFNFLQPATKKCTDQNPQGGILHNTRFGWLALGPKFCVVDLKTGLKVAAHTFGAVLSNFNTIVTSVVELPRPLTHNSQQLIISLECEDVAGMICVFHVNGSQILRCIQTDVIITELSVCDRVPDGPIACFDGVIIAGTRTGELFALDLNRSSLIQALKDLSQGNEHLVRTEVNSTNLTFLQLDALQKMEEQREYVLENGDHIAVLLNESSLLDGQYIFCNPDGTVRLKAKRDHIKVSTLKYIPQLASIAVGFNFGAFQIWNLMTLDLEFTSQVNVDCLPVTHFGFQEPCDDPRAFCYLWVVFSVIDRIDEEEFPWAVMYSLTYQGKRMLSDTKCLYQNFSLATLRFQVELGAIEQSEHFVGGRCVSCHTYSVDSPLGEEGEDNMLNICHLVWECWGDNASSSTQYGMLLFDLDQWYKDQMPATYRLESNAFMSATWCPKMGQCQGSRTLHVRLDPVSVCPYSHATRLEEHFYPNSLQYDVICLTTSEAYVLSTIGIQRQIIASMEEVGPTALLNPQRLYTACVAAGLKPLYHDTYSRTTKQEEQRNFVLSVALEARLSRLLRRCAHAWATHTHAAVGCTLPALVDWCWKRALELKENAKELIAPLFVSSTLPDRNVVRCLEHCVQQLSQLTSLLDAILTKCCNLVVPDALSEIEERHKCVGTVSLYFGVVQWFLRVGLLPERHALPYPAAHLAQRYATRRVKLHRLQDRGVADEEAGTKLCSLLYIDQLIEEEFGGDRIREMWMKGGSEYSGLYPPPSLSSLLRLYLLTDVASEHKHSLVLYLLLDYSMLYDEVRYEAVIRRLMQFPTMFGLSNTAIKATQAFWHLDHRDFDFALDQLQCLTGNTLSDWQHNVVLSSLLAQKKTQAALQYLHVRKPAPIQNVNKEMNIMLHVNEHVKLEDWQSCCNLYLARGLVFEALDVIRTCVKNAASANDKVHLLTYFFKGCRNTGQLSKVLHVTLLPFEEEVFIKYLKDCNDIQTSDILVIYFLQQARYLEAQQYNNKLKNAKSTHAKERRSSTESLLDIMEWQCARDTMVGVACDALPAVTRRVVTCLTDTHYDTHVIAPKPMSVYVQATSPKNTFIYKSSFIQDTIENASETWINKPKLRQGIKRALHIEETPFICTPKLSRNRSIFNISSEQNEYESTPPKRPKMDLSGPVKTPKVGSTIKVSAQLSRQMETLLHMPEVESPDVKIYGDRSGAETPHSILKSRREGDGVANRELVSPVDSRYLGESEDELLETASNHTHYSDSTNKHLRFAGIPTTSEGGSTPSPLGVAAVSRHLNVGDATVTDHPTTDEKDMDVSLDSYATTASHAMNECHPLESPTKRFATEDKVKFKKSYKDTVRARRSISMNSTFSDDPNSSVESIADIPFTLINLRYSNDKPKRNENALKLNLSDTLLKLDHPTTVKDESAANISDSTCEKIHDVSPPKSPKMRRGIRLFRESPPLVNRSRSVTPERPDSPVVASLRAIRKARSRSKTPELSPRSSPLPPIAEQPRHEQHSEPHAVTAKLLAPTHSFTSQMRSRPCTPEHKDKLITVSPRLEAITESPSKTTDSPPATPERRSLRSRSRTPERKDKVILDSPRLEAITESPTKPPDSPSKSPSRRSLRSRSRTPEVEVADKMSTASGETTVQPSPRILRSRSRTPEVEVADKNSTGAAETTVQPSPRILRSRSKTPEKIVALKMDRSVRSQKSLSRMVLEANTFSKTKQITEHNDNHQTENKTKSTDLENIVCTPVKPSHTVTNLMDITFSPIVNKSILQSSPESIAKVTDESAVTSTELQPMPAFTTINETSTGKSVLHSYESSVAESSQIIQENISEHIDARSQENKNKQSSANPEYKKLLTFTSINETYERSVLRSYQSSVADSANNIETSVSILQETNIQELPLNISIVSNNKSILKDVSSLITSDSDVDIKDDHWEEKDKATQKEKERIVEIEREINEIEEDMSNDSENEEVSSDDEIILAAEEQSNEETDESSDDDSSGSDSDDEIISIKDTDSEESGSSLEKLQIDECISKSNELDYLTKKHIKTKTEIVIMKKNDEDTNENTKQKPSITEKQPVDIKKVHSDTKPKEDKEPMELILEKETPNLYKNIGESILSDDNSIDELNSQSIKSKIAVEENKIIDEDKQQSMSDTKQEEPNDPLNDCGLSILTDDSMENNQSKVNFNPINISEFETKQKETDTIMNTEVKDIPVINNPVEELQSIETEHSVGIVENVARVKGTIDTETVGNKKQDSENIHKVQKHKNDSESIPQKRNISEQSPQSISYDSVNIDDEEKAPKTPLTRKRSKSIASNTSTDDNKQKTLENVQHVDVGTPSSKRRSKTPSSVEVRTILTRRASKELADKDDSIIFEEIQTTPTKRSARTKTKSIDDNASVASDTPVSSSSKISEGTGDVKPAQVRKGRKSILNTKTDLSVIQEIGIEELEKSKNTTQEDYSKTKRLAPNQKASTALMASSPTLATPSRGRVRRAPSRSSVATASEQSDEDDATSIATSTDTYSIRSIDRITLLNKGDFEARMGRGASESKQIPKAAKINRTKSADVAAAPESTVESPSRGRRASFARAIEALHTPRSRRTSTDVALQKGEKSPTDSLASEGEASGTPKRRSRRASSAASQTKMEGTPTKSKKTSAVLK